MHVVQKLLAVVQADFNPTTWEAFQRFGVDGVPAGRVAEDLGLSENAVFLAKSRVLKKLREEAGDLLW
jgi:RNA polymerase sigma-70 factor, ECF subfamily